VADNYITPKDIDVVICVDKRMSFSNSILPVQNKINFLLQVKVVKLKFLKIFIVSALSYYWFRTSGKLIDEVEVTVYTTS